MRVVAHQRTGGFVIRSSREAAGSDVILRKQPLRIQPNAQRLLRKLASLYLDA